LLRLFAQKLQPHTSLVHTIRTTTTNTGSLKALASSPGFLDEKKKRVFLFLDSVP
jgi:hypothetical protein